VKARHRVGQEIGRRLAVQHDRVADFIQAGIGADGCELGRAVAARLRPKSFVVVPKKGVGGHKDKVAAAGLQFLVNVPII
jgi:hypothetical protein